MSHRGRISLAQMRLWTSIREGYGNDPSRRLRRDRLPAPRGRGIGIVNKIRAYALQDQGADTVEANIRLGLAVDARDYSQCAEIIRSLGLEKIRLMSNNPDKVAALRNAGLEVTERVSLEVKTSPSAFRYLRTKKERIGHLLQLDGVF